ncbi:serine palmitoyltransferase 1 [Zophobas morio]|uniref:serine palmitoyltransferase 1 n=1 Tax=Zophobas morio TaxID=2755281 RepID=UPI003083C94E
MIIIIFYFIYEHTIKVLQKYGVGSCGPRGFYGTIDVHLILENELAKFLNVEEVIIYSYGFATNSSAIPPYSGRSDIIFCDEGLSFSNQTGLLAAKSRVIWFRHNNMQHLEELLNQQAQEDRKNPKKAKHIRRLIVVEGLYRNYGDICPLPQLLQFKKKYKCRIFIDESNSFGVLGKGGRGVTEHYSINPEDVDQIYASMENALASVGGFCAGSKFLVDHQRLQGKGYCFSASLPPINAEAARLALQKLQKDSKLLNNLKENVDFLWKELLSFRMKLHICGYRQISPIIHLRLPESATTREEKKQILQSVVDFCYNNGVLLVMPEYIESAEKHLPEPSIRITVSSKHTKDELRKVACTVNEASLFALG